MQNNEKPNKKILLGLFDAKTQSPEEIAEIANEQLKKLDRLRKENLTTEELQKAVKPYISRTTTAVKKENKIKKIFVAVGSWIWSVIKMWAGWLILVLFMFSPPVIVILLIGIFTGIEPNAYAILACLALIVLYWLAIFKTRPGRKYFDWIQKISGTD